MISTSLEIFECTINLSFKIRFIIIYLYLTQHIEIQLYNLFLYYILPSNAILDILYSISSFVTVHVNNVNYFKLLQRMAKQQHKGIDYGYLKKILDLHFK